MIGMAEASGGVSREVPAAPSTDTPDLSVLLEASSRGDEDAFAALYDHSSRRVYGLILRVLRDPSQAEEVTQEVYAEVWRTSDRFDSARGSVLAWMSTMAHRRAVDRVRAAQAQTDRDTVYHRETRPVEHDQTAEAAQRNLEADRVRVALRELTLGQREAIELAYFGGYTHSEVADRLDLPLGTAKTRIRDGLTRLRNTLGLER